MDTGRYHRIVEEIPEAEPEPNGASSPEVLDVRAVAEAIVGLRDEVHGLRASVESDSNRKWASFEKLRAEVLGAVDTLEGKVLGAIGTLSNRVLEMGAAAGQVREKLDSVTEEHDADITQTRKAIDGLAKTDAELHDQVAKARRMARIKVGVIVAAALAARELLPFIQRLFP